MGWLFEVHKTQLIARAVGVLTFACVLGMALGSLKFRGIGLASWWDISAKQCITARSIS